MGSIIHMETETVRDLALKIWEELAKKYEDVEIVKNQVNSIPWEGRTKDAYLVEFNNLSRTIKSRLEDGTVLMHRVQKEVDGWIAVDAKNAAAYVKERSGWEKFKDRMNKIVDDWQHQQELDEAKEKFNEWWKTLDENGKKEYLTKLYEQIAKRWGMEVLPLNFSKLDGKGDLLGYYQDSYKVIELDLDDVNSRSGFNLISDLAHEARHQHQWQSVRYFEQTGNPPEGVSLQEVQGWKENLDNYIPADKNPIGYMFQKVEIDARVEGTNFANDFMLETNGGGGFGGGGGGSY